MKDLITSKKQCGGSQQKERGLVTRTPGGFQRGETDSTGKSRRGDADEPGREEADLVMRMIPGRVMGGLCFGQTGSRPVARMPDRKCPEPD